MRLYEEKNAYIIYKLTNMGQELELMQLRKDFEDFKRKVESYEKRESTIIELNAFMKKYISETFIGYTTKSISFGRIKDPYTGEKLTEFDGIVMLVQNINKKIKEVSEPFSSDRQHKIAQAEEQRNDKIKSIKKQNTSKAYIPKNPSRILIIIEAKRHVTKDKVMMKIRQYLHLQDMVREAKKPYSKLHHKSFKGTIAGLGLQDVEHVYLYIGGVHWDDDALEKVNEATLINPRVGYVTPSGDRFQVQDQWTIERA